MSTQWGQIGVESVALGVTPRFHYLPRNFNDDGSKKEPGGNEDDRLTLTLTGDQNCVKARHNGVRHYGILCMSDGRCCVLFS